MARDIHGELKDVGDEDEGWPIYVLTSKQLQELEVGHRVIAGHAMIFVYAATRMLYWEHNRSIQRHLVLDDSRETLIQLFRQPREVNGQIVQTSKNNPLLYRVTKTMASQTGTISSLFT